MFPTDAITVRSENTTSNDNVAKSILPSGTYTILGINFHSQTPESSTVSCGSNIIARDYSTYNTDKYISFLCVDTVTASLDNKTSIFITYVPYNLSLTSTTTQQTATSSVILTRNGFTYGEVLIILVLLMIFTVTFFSELKQWIFGVRVENPIKNKYNKDL
jgi:hypothetical protein